MTEELRVWFDVLYNGSTRPPRTPTRPGHRPHPDQLVDADAASVGRRRARQPARDLPPRRSRRAPRERQPARHTRRRPPIDLLGAARPQAGLHQPDYTANARLFVHQHSAGNLNPVGRLWVARILGMAPSALRADRILDEAIATRGDARRICDLFAINIKTAERYLRILDPPGLQADSGLDD